MRAPGTVSISIVPRPVEPANAASGAIRTGANPADYRSPAIQLALRGTPMPLPLNRDDNLDTSVPHVTIPNPKTDGTASLQGVPIGWIPMTSKVEDASIETDPVLPLSFNRVRCNSA
jgi:hypothetical protein